MAYKRTFFKVNAGTIRYKDQVYSAGAEFPAAIKDMDEFRAQGVVSLVSGPIVYRNRVPGAGRKDRRVMPMLPTDSLMTMCKTDLLMVERNERCLAAFRRIFPEYTRTQVKRLTRPAFTKLIVEKRGF
jgi:hypothetical protein